MIPRIAKITAWSAVGLVGLFIVVFIVLKAVTDDQYKKWIVSAVESVTDRDFSIEEFSIDLGSSVAIKADGVRMANAPWSVSGDMLAVGHIETEVNLLALVKGVADIRLASDDVKILAETSLQGESNWDFSPSDQPADDAEAAELYDWSVPLRPLIREVRLENIAVKIVQGENRPERNAVLHRLLIETPHQDSTLSLSAMVDDIPMEFTGNLGNLETVLTGSENPIRLDGKIEHNQFDLTGVWGPMYPDANMQLALNVDAPSASRLAEIAGLSMAELGELRIGTELSAVDGKLRLPRIRADLDGELAVGSLEGSIENIVDQHGLNLSLAFKTQRLNKLSQQLELDIPFTLPKSVDITAQVSGQLDTLTISDLVAEIEDEDLEIRIEGAINDARSLSGVDGEFEFKSESSTALGRYIDMTIPDLGTVVATGKVISDGDNVGLKELAASTKSPDIDLWIEGGIADLSLIQGIDLDVGAEVRSFSEKNLADLEKLLKQLKVEFPLLLLPQSASVKGKVAGDREQLAIHDIVAEVVDEGLSVRLGGSIENVTKLAGVNVDIDLNGAGVNVFSKYAGIELPDLGPVVVVGKVISDGDKIGIKELDARTTSQDIDLQIEGGIADLPAFQGIDLHVDAEVRSFNQKNLADLEELLTQLKIEFPLELLPRTASVKGKVSGNLEQLAIQDIVAAVADEGLVMNLSGSIDDVIKLEGVKAEANLNSSSTAAFSKYAGMELPELGPLEVSTKVKSSGEVLRLEIIEAKLGAGIFDAKLLASVDDLLAMNGVNATLDASIGSISMLSQLTGTPLPETDPVTLHAKLTHQPEIEGNPEWMLIEATSGDILAKIEGSIASLVASDDFQFVIDVTSDSLASFGQYANQELPDDGPFKVVGKVTAESGYYSLSDFQLESGEQSVSGNIGIRLAEQVGGLSRLDGELVIPYLDLTPFMISQATEEPVAESKASNSAPLGKTKEVEPETDVDAISDGIDVVASDRLFPTDPLPLGQLRRIDADFSIAADRLKIGQTEMSDFIFEVAIKDGLLTIGPINAVAGEEGAVYGYITLDGQTDTGDFDAEVFINKLPTPKLGGKLDLNVDVSGSGTSVAEIMGGIDGQLRLVMRDGTVEDSFITDLGAGLFSFADNEKSTRLECLILRMDIADGLADFEDKLAAQLTEARWRGGGNINFKTEKIRMGIKPTPREALTISAGSLASLVYIGGTIKDPNVRLNPKDVALKYGKYLAYLSTGGLSFVTESLFKRLQADKDICALDLAGTAFEIDPGSLMKAKQNRQPQQTPKENR